MASKFSDFDKPNINVRQAKFVEKALKHKLSIKAEKKGYYTFYYIYKDGRRTNTNFMSFRTAEDYVINK